MVTLATEPNEKSFRIGAVTLTLIVLAWLPLLVVYATHLWALPHYQYFPMVLVAAVVLARQRLADGGEIWPGNPTASKVLSVVPIGMLAVSILLNSPWLAAVSALLMLWVLIYRAGSFDLLSILFPAWVMLWLAISLPMQWDTVLILSLQRFTASCSGNILDFLGVIHHLSGTIVELPGKRVLVEEACSGVHSLFSAGAFTIFLVMWQRASWIRSILLVLSVPIWVVLANVARVVVITVLLARYNYSVDEGTLHEAIGFVAFALAVLLILSANHALKYFVGDSTSQSAQADESEPQIALKAQLPELASPAMCIVASLLIVLQIAIYASLPSLEVGPRALGPIAGINAESLPADWENWEQISFNTVQRRTDSNFGPVSQTWEYRCGEMYATVSIDYPFFLWHELSACYINQGWHLEGRGSRKIEGFRGNPTEVVELQLSGPQGTERAHVAFSLCRTSGIAMDPPAVEPWRDAWNRVVRGQSTSVLGWLSEKYSSPQSVQLQVCLRSFTDIDEQQRQQAARFLSLMFNRLLPHWTDQAQPPQSQEKRSP
jgi:exosortase